MTWPPGIPPLPTFGEIFSKVALVIMLTVTTVSMLRTKKAEDARMEVHIHVMRMTRPSKFGRAKDAYIH